jgi:hypothetical protein
MAAVYYWRMKTLHWRHSVCPKIRSSADVTATPGTSLCSSPAARKSRLGAGPGSCPAARGSGSSAKTWRPGLSGEAGGLPSAGPVHRLVEILVEAEAIRDGRRLGGRLTGTRDKVVHIVIAAASTRIRCSGGSAAHSADSCAVSRPSTTFNTRDNCRTVIRDTYRSQRRNLFSSNSNSRTSSVERRATMRGNSRTICLCPLRKWSRSGSAACVSERLAAIAATAKASNCSVKRLPGYAQGTRTLFTPYSAQSNHGTPHLSPGV